MPESSQAQTAPHREHTSPQRSESLWGNPTYRQWFTADTASTIGAAMKGFAISLIAFSLTQSVVLAGWLATFSQIATHVSDVFGGTVVDRHNRKGLIIANAVFGTLLWGTVFVLIALHAIAFPIFAIVTVAASAVNGLLANATNAMLRTIIPTREYPKAQSLNQGRDSVVSIAGSPLGGVLYAVAPWLPFAVASLMYAISGVSAAQLRVDEHVRDMVTTDRKSKRPDTASQAGCTSDAVVAPDADATAESAHTSFFEDFIEGWRWTLRRHTLLAICVIAALVNFGLNGVFAAVNLQLVSTHVDSVRLGFVNTVMGVGMLIGAVIAARVCERVHMGTGLVVLSVTSLLTLLPMLFSSDYLVILASHPHHQLAADGIRVRQSAERDAGTCRVGERHAVDDTHAVLLSARRLPAATHRVRRHDRPVPGRACGQCGHRAADAVDPLAPRRRPLGRRVAVTMHH